MSDEQPSPLQIALTSGLENCARCGETHAEPLIWHMFVRPAGDYRYWATCPSNGDPILLQVKDNGPEDHEERCYLAGYGEDDGTAVEPD